jgi:hypothetical protein
MRRVILEPATSLLCTGEPTELPAASSDLPAVALARDGEP